MKFKVNSARDEHRLRSKSSLLVTRFISASISLTFSAAFLLLVFATTSNAQQAVSLQKNSPERKAILDTLRIPVERRLKQKIVFRVDEIRVSGNWAFMSGAPMAPDGKSPDYRNTPFSAAIEAGAFDNNIFALFQKKAGKWKVVTYAIGCTDVCYADWHRRYKAPKSVFPYTE